MCKTGGPRCKPKSPALSKARKSQQGSVASKALGAGSSRPRLDKSTVITTGTPIPAPRKIANKASNTLTMRRYSTAQSHPSVTVAFSDLSSLLSSLPQEYQAQRTVETMKLTEDMGLSEAHHQHSMAIATLDFELGAGTIDKQQWSESKALANRDYRAAQRKAKTNWRQSEWLAFNFENSVVRAKDYDHVGGVGYKAGNTTFDTMVGPEGNKIPMDVKFHAMYLANGQPNTSVILNDKQAIDDCIEKYGALALLVAKAEVKHDATGEVKRFHNELKNIGRRTRPTRTSNSAQSRVLKSSALVVEYSIYVLTQDNKHLLGDFKQGVQATGSPRKPKYSLYFGQGGLTPVAKFVTDYGLVLGR